MIADFILSILGVKRMREIDAQVCGAQAPATDAQWEARTAEAVEQFERLVRLYPIGSEWMVLGQEVVVIGHREPYRAEGEGLARRLWDESAAVIAATRVANGRVETERYTEDLAKALFRRVPFHVVGNSLTGGVTNV